MKRFIIVILCIVMVLPLAFMTGCQKEEAKAPPPAQPKAGGYGAPSGGYGAPPATGGYGAPSGGYGAPPAAGGYGAPPPSGGYGAPPASK